jgi:hypothetical protein
MIQTSSINVWFKLFDGLSEHEREHSSNGFRGNSREPPLISNKLEKFDRFVQPDTLLTVRTTV